MMSDAAIDELNDFLARHDSVARPQILRLGDRVGEWCVTAYLGHGGHAEVYRVEKGTRGTTATSGTGDVAALKVLVRDDMAARARFAQEARLLADATSPSLPRFYGVGECDGRPYIVLEILEPVDLPRRERDVAAYLLAVCRAVSALHRQGLVHRDIKPSNIMRRANGEVVLIDLGLVKDTARSSRPESNVSIIDGRPVAVGTPAYAAPEQILGGEVSPAIDIHALGKLADVCFGDNPPRAWQPIVRRATSSIPAQRYATVEELAKAIRRRHWPRRALIAAALAAAAFVVAAVVGSERGRRTPSATELVHREMALDESAAWLALQTPITTNAAVRELAWERPEANDTGRAGVPPPAVQRAYRKVRRDIEATRIALNGRTNVFERPLVLDASREWFIVGPGVLDATLVASTNGAVVHLKNCFVINRSDVPVESANIRYVFDRGVYLNFTRAEECPREVFARCFENYDAAFSDVRFGGPETIRGYDRLRRRERQDLLRRATHSSSRNFTSPRWISPARGKYRGEIDFQNRFEPCLGFEVCYKRGNKRTKKVV